MVSNRSAASPIRLSKSDQNILISAPCLVVQKAILAISTWSRKLGYFAPPPAQCEGSDPIEIDLTPFLHPRIRSIYGKLSNCDGPNCFSTAMVGAGVHDYLRFYSETEWINLLSSCVPREGGEREPGDIVSVEKSPQEGFQETPIANPSSAIHGFIYINDDLAFSKNGFLKHKSPEIYPLSDVASLYGVRNQDCLSGPKIGCSTFLKYYDCSKLTRLQRSIFSKVVEDSLNCHIYSNNFSFSQFNVLAPQIQKILSVGDFLPGFKSSINYQLEMTVFEHYYEDPSQITKRNEDYLYKRDPSGFSLFERAVKNNDVDKAGILYQKHLDSTNLKKRKPTQKNLENLFDQEPKKKKQVP